MWGANHEDVWGQGGRGDRPSSPEPCLPQVHASAEDPEACTFVSAFTSVPDSPQRALLRQKPTSPSSASSARCPAACDRTEVEACSFAQSPDRQSRTRRTHRTATPTILRPSPPLAGGGFLSFAAASMVDGEVPAYDDVGEEDLEHIYLDAIGNIEPSRSSAADSDSNERPRHTDRGESQHRGSSFNANALPPRPTATATHARHDRHDDQSRGQPSSNFSSPGNQKDCNDDFGDGFHTVAAYDFHPGNSAHNSLPKNAASGSGANLYRAKVIAFYEEHNRAKLAIVDRLLLKYNGREEAMMKELEDIYGRGATTAPTTATTATTVTATTTTVAAMAGGAVTPLKGELSPSSITPPLQPFASPESSPEPEKMKVTPARARHGRHDNDIVPVSFAEYDQSREVERGAFGGEREGVEEEAGGGGKGKGKGGKPKKSLMTRMWRKTKKTVAGKYR